MKEKVLTELKNKFKDLGFGTTELGVFADFITPMVENEDKIGEVIDKAEPLLKMFQQNTDRLRGEKSKAEKEMKKLKDQLAAALADKDDKSEGAKGEDSTKDDTPVWAKAIIDRLAALEGEKVQTSRKTRLEKAIENLPDSLKKIYGHIDLKALDDDGYNSLIEEVTQEAKDFEGDMVAKRLVFSAPKSVPKTAPKDEPTDKEVDDLLASLGV